MIKTATISKCGLYRYDLTRRWAVGERLCAFIGLNPSTADADLDDPTIRRCVGFAQSWGYDALVMLNAYAFRATKPTDMLAAADPVGPANDAYLKHWCSQAHLKVAAWGANISLHRQKQMIQLILDLAALRITKEGFPGHPLYLPKVSVPVPWGTSQTKTPPKPAAPPAERG